MQAKSSRATASWLAVAAVVTLSGCGGDSVESPVASAPPVDVAQPADAPVADPGYADEASADMSAAAPAPVDLGRPPAVPEGYENRGGPYPPTDSSGAPQLDAGEVAAGEAPAEMPADAGDAESTVAYLGRPPAVPEGYENRGATYPPDQVAEQPTDGSAGYESGATDPPTGYENRGYTYPREGYPPADAGTMADQPQDPAVSGDGAELTGAALLMQQAKSALGGFFGGAAPGDAAGLVPTGEPGVPLPNSPNYHAQLAELLFDAQSPHHELAVQTLLKIPPRAVQDKKLRGRIAKGYQHVAFETNAHVAEAVEGLVIWGGKYSAPLLIKLLEGGNAPGADGAATAVDATETDRAAEAYDAAVRTRGGGEELGRPGMDYSGRGGMEGLGGGSGPVAEEVIFVALGKLATPEAADAIVKRMGESSFSSESALAALRAMGPVAEGALLRALPFETPEANLSAIALLGDVGTKKSVAMLRRATKSENEGIVETALEAIRKIQQRGQPAATPG